MDRTEVERTIDGTEPEAGERRAITRRSALALLAAAPLAARGWSMSGTPTAEPLLRRPVGASGESLPIVGLGTYRSFDAGPSPAERAPLREVLGAFVAAGASVVDSSPMYGRAEGVIGDLAAELGVRDRLFLATKVWTSGRAEGIAQMETSLRLLRTPTIDLMQVHNLLDVDVHLRTLAEWRRQGRTRFVGITHYTASAHGELARRIRAGGVDFVQVNYSVVEREAERELLPLARERGVAVLANRPFVGGEAFRRLRDRALPDWLASAGVATWAQAMLKFVLGHPAITCAIPATSKVRHLEENLEAGRGWLPSEEERERLARELERALGA
ncbi:MAG: aldo/keto reductase [Holophagales bacterium]|nr:aldo/keto reductase [Holophagales bacterium]